MEIQTPYKKQKAFVKAIVLTAFISLLLITFSPVSIVALKGFSERINALAIMCWGTLYFTRIFFVTQLYLACICIRKRFEGLNNKLDWLVRQKSPKIVDWRLGKLYNELCDVIDILNETFTAPFVFIFPNILIKSIFAAFALVHEFKLQSPNNSYVYVICGFALVNYLGLVIVVAREGSRLTTTATATGAIITQMMSGDQLNQTQKTDFIFLQSQVRGRNVGVKNFLFTINWKVLLSVG
jgi:hypothetical protein